MHKGQLIYYPMLKEDYIPFLNYRELYPFVDQFQVFNFFGKGRDLIICNRNARHPKDSEIKQLEKY